MEQYRGDQPGEAPAPQPGKESRARMRAEAREARDRRRFDPYDEDELYDGRPRRGRRGGRFRRRLILWLVLLLLLLSAIVFAWSRLKGQLTGAFTPRFEVKPPESLSDLLPDETMGYSAVDFSNVILGESREKKSLVVMEQDAEVTSQISQSLLNIPLFSMAKLIHSYGTGVYTVDLAALTEADVAADMETKIVTVTVPHAVLAYVTVDADKTEIEDTKKALLAIGEIKLTQEQQTVLDQSVDEALHAQLSMPAVLTKADELALIKVRELFQPLISALSEDFLVKVIMA